MSPTTPKFNKISVGARRVGVGGVGIGWGFGVWHFRYRIPKKSRCHQPTYRDQKSNLVWGLPSHIGEVLEKGRCENLRQWGEEVSVCPASNS